MAILDQLNSISRDTGQFVAGILTNDISRDDQVHFALRLMRLAAHIEDRATSSVGMVIEGTAVDDYALPAPSSRSIDPVDHPRTTEDG